MHNVVLYYELTACAFWVKCLLNWWRITCFHVRSLFGSGGFKWQSDKGVVVRFDAFDSANDGASNLIGRWGCCIFVCHIVADLAFILWFFLLFLGWGTVSVWEVGMHLNRSYKTLWLVCWAPWEMQSFVPYWQTSRSCHCARRWRAGQCLPLLLGYRYT